MPDFTYAEIAKMIDHSLLQPTLTDAELEQGCLLAREYDAPRFASSLTRFPELPNCSPARPWPLARPSVFPTAGMQRRSR